ncbi:hypothetical protein [Caldivirga sp.]|uniref:hypothetical protein n=1 Tax=Caldivirga sp. TaxID=2080243 RepID=UPI003D111EE4
MMSQSSSSSSIYNYQDLDFEVISVKPMVIKALVEDEELIINVYPMVTKVLKYGKDYSIWVNVVVSVKTNKPKPGPPCNPNIVVSRSAKADKVEVLSDGILRLRLSDGTEKDVTIKSTNVSFYPDYRDQFGAPCTIVNWSVFWR